MDHASFLYYACESRTTTLRVTRQTSIGSMRPPRCRPTRPGQQVSSYRNVHTEMSSTRDSCRWVWLEFYKNTSSGEPLENATHIGAWKHVASGHQCNKYLDSIRKVPRDVSWILAAHRYGSTRSESYRSWRSNSPTRRKMGPQLDTPSGLIQSVWVHYFSPCLYASNVWEFLYNVVLCLFIGDI